MRNPTVCVVIPAKNEARNLPLVLKKIPGWIDEVILVDGNSEDDTIAVARNLMPGIKIVSEDRPGKGAALRCGFAASRSDIIVMIDADGSMDPAEIPAFVGALLSGADFVKGSRFLQGGGTDDMEWYRRIGNWGFVKLVTWRFGGRFTDLCYGYIAFWRESLQRLSLENDDGFEIETSMNVQALQAQLAISEVPSKEAPRAYGVSNLRTFPDGWRVLMTIARLGLPLPGSRLGTPAPISNSRLATNSTDVRNPNP
ncbi:MAG: glycosyltransferase family 2 protein [Roseibium sp.]|uniref:glycosyltransferase family 2 protein n=1 Tax=Roseibium sp. TaxID=1936156 RepID=UPI002604BB82|nr:glycosyltransferase family 2 protein [Roseibium sp.]MCV0424209.1 glycosyltransferase family 2 protein [Roseibium sp.]